MWHPCWVLAYKKTVYVAEKNLDTPSTTLKRPAHPTIVTKDATSPGKLKLGGDLMAVTIVANQLIENTGLHWDCPEINSVFRVPARKYIMCL